MHRSYVEPGCWQDDTFTLGPEEEHHLLDVLRARDGDTVEVFDGQGRMCRATVELLKGRSGRSKSAQRVVLKAAAGTQREIKQGLRITLVQSILKHDRMDLVLEKATELGVAEIVPVIMERVVVRISRDRREERRKRWERIVLGAAKQCHCSHIPDVRPIVPLSEALQHAGEWDLFITGSLRENAKSLRSILESAAPVDHVCVLIGPEGDMTDAELQSAVEAGGIPVTFGTQVLRSETASVYAVSAIRFALEIA